MKKLLIALLLLPVIGNAAEMTADEADTVRTNATMEINTVIENHGPELGVTPSGMKMPMATALKFTGMLHEIVAQGLSQGATCDQVKAVIKERMIAPMQKEFGKVAGAASLTLAMSEFTAADCITTRARMEAAK